jgi:hypothetical protein
MPEHRILVLLFTPCGLGKAWIALVFGQVSSRDSCQGLGGYFSHINCPDLA